MFLEILTCRTCRSDRTCWRDMVGSDRIPEDTQNPCVYNIRDRCRLSRKAFKEGWMLDISASLVPWIENTCRASEFFPFRCLVADRFVHFFECAPVNRCANHLGNLLTGGPNVLQIDRFTCFVMSKRFRSEINVNPTCDAVGNNKWWRHQEVGFYLWMYTRFKISVATQNTGGDEIPRIYCLLNHIVEGAAVTDAGCASVAYDVIAECLKIGQQPRIL